MYQYHKSCYACGENFWSPEELEGHTLSKCVIQLSHTIKNLVARVKELEENRK